MDQPPAYCYANWDDATRELVGPDSFPPSDYCNVSCAYHLADPVATFRRVHRAIREGKAVSAHPGMDMATNGRHISPEDVYTHTICQLGALKAMVEAEGGKLSHVKPHGILFILLRDQAPLMRAFLKAHVALLGTDVPFHGLAETTHEAVALEMGVPFVAEILKDTVEPPRPRPTATPPRQPERRRTGLSIRRVRSGLRGRPRAMSASAPAAVTPLAAPVPAPAARAPAPAPASPASAPQPRPSLSASLSSPPPSSDSPRPPTRTLSASSSASTPGPSSPCPSPSPGLKENSASRLLRTIQFYTRASIPDIIEAHRGSTPTGVRVAVGAKAH